LTFRRRFDYIAASRAGPSGAGATFVYPGRLFQMTRRCELTGVGPMIGHHVSHSNVKSKRRFLPALAPASLQSESLGQTFRLRISNAALRTVDFRGGLDAFLLKARDEKLSARALKIKKQVKAKAAAATTAAA
jgi:large subunit ribosomal protein L28